MELDDLKRSWEEINNQPGNQQKINLKMINKMTQIKYNTRLKKIAYPEIAGTIICFIGAVFIILNFNKLHTFFLQATALFVLAFLVVMPVISLSILQQLHKIGDLGKPYVETLKTFARQKIRFHKFQRLSATLSYILMVGLIFLIPPFFGGKNMSDNKYFWILTIPLGYIFQFFFSKLVLKSYGKTLRQAEELLKELE